MTGDRERKSVVERFARRDMQAEDAVEALRGNPKAAGRAVSACCREEMMDAQRACVLLAHMDEEAAKAAMADTLGHLRGMETRDLDREDVKMLAQLIRSGGKLDADGVQALRACMSDKDAMPFAGAVSVVVTAAMEGRRSLAEVLGGDEELAARLDKRAKLSFSAGFPPGEGGHAAKLYPNGKGADRSR